MFKRVWMSVCLMLVLGFDQQLAITHVYQHDADWFAGKASTKDELHSAAKVCAKCLALADFQSAPPSHVHPFHPLVAQSPRAYSLPVHTSASANFVYRARAPPLLA